MLSRSFGHLKVEIGILNTSPRVQHAETDVLFPTARWTRTRSKRPSCLPRFFVAASLLKPLNPSQSVANITKRCLISQLNFIGLSIGAS